MDESYRHNTGWKKSETKERLLCDSVHMMFKNRQNESIAIEVRVVVILGGTTDRGTSEPSRYWKYLVF